MTPGFITPPPDSRRVDGVNRAYDDAGNKTSVEDHTGRWVEYTYDELACLTQETITHPNEGDRYAYEK